MRKEEREIRQRAVSSGARLERSARAARVPPNTAMASSTAELATRSSTSPIEASLLTTLWIPASSSRAFASWASTGDANLASATSGSVPMFIS